MPKEWRINTSKGIVRFHSVGEPIVGIPADLPPIEAPQRCKVCGKDSIRVICDSEDCSLEFYSAEYQEWPEDEDSGLGTDEGEEY